jgi:1-acyl-sn-glycerol-3-phosphate acyltransferase
VARRKAGFWIRFCVLVIYPVDSLLFKLRWRGTEQVPKSGGVILVANHLSYVDPLPFVRFIWDSGRIPRILVKASLFRSKLIGPVMRGAAQIPVHRGSTGAGDSLRDAVAALDRGEAVCIYPEGTVTRDPDWWPMRAKTGVARLALQTDVPVIPIAQWGAQFCYDRYNHKLSLLPRKALHITAGPPVDLSAYRGKPVTAELVREVTDVIMSAVRDQLAIIRDQTPPTTFFERPANLDHKPAAPQPDPAVAAPSDPQTDDPTPSQRG